MLTADRMGLEHEELTGSILGAAIEVHNVLGPGFLESVYENALAIELESRGVCFERQLAVPILYRGAEVDGIGWTCSWPGCSLWSSRQSRLSRMCTSRWFAPT